MVKISDESLLIAIRYYCNQHTFIISSKEIAILQYINYVFITICVFMKGVNSMNYYCNDCPYKSCAEHCEDYLVLLQNLVEAEKLIEDLLFQIDTFKESNESN